MESSADSTQASYENVRTALKDIAEKKAIDLSTEQVNLINQKATQIADQATISYKNKVADMETSFKTQLTDKDALIQHKNSENSELSKKIQEMSAEMDTLKKFRQDHMDKLDKKSKDVFQRALKLHTENRPNQIFAFSDNAHNTKECNTQLMESLCEIIDTHQNHVHEPTVQTEELPHNKRQRTSSGLIDYTQFT